MNSVVFGKYIPIDSLIHRIDPRAKLIGLIAMIIAVFTPKSWYVFVLLGLMTILAVFIAKLNLKFIWSAFKPMLFMMAFLLVINVLTVKTGALLFKIGKVEVYYDGIFNTLFVIVRLLLMVMITTLITATTKPLDLTLGIEALLKPLKLFKFPTHELAMMISIALRFIPTIIEETIRIMNAQKSRGVDYENGRFAEKINAILSLIIPLFSVAFERAYELADAMEARGYVPDKQRSRFHVLKYSFKDFVFIFITICLMAMSITSRFVL